MVVLHLEERLVGPLLEGSSQLNQISGSNSARTSTSGAAGRMSVSGTAGGTDPVGRNVLENVLAVSDAGAGSSQGLYLWRVLDHESPLEFGLERQRPPPEEAALEPGMPRKCCLPTCGLPERLMTADEQRTTLERSGVRLLVCACSKVHYCTPEHQKAHWPSHRLEHHLVAPPNEGST